MLLSQVRSVFVNWRRDERGAVVPLFALMLIVVVGISGLAMDFARQERLRARLSEAADAANLAAARAAASTQETNPAKSPEEIIAQAQELGRKHFAANIQDLGDVSIKDLDIKVSFDGGFWTSQVIYGARSKTTLGMALGRRSINVNGKSEASISPGFPVLDIAMCVDSTGSMSSTLDAVKTNAINFYDNLNAALTAKGVQPFPLVRVRLMYFKDFGDGSGLQDPDPLVTSNFFRLPDDAGSFNAFASPQVASGGWDWPESGLECLNEAMDSPWTNVGDIVSGFSQKVTDVYPLVVVWTDASSHRIGYPNSLANPSYPSAATMPRTYADFLAKWNNGDVVDQTHKQILFFGDPAQASSEADGGESGWSEIMTWPKFTLGGTVTEANTDPVEFIANGIAKNAKGLRLTN